MGTTILRARNRPAKNASASAASSSALERGEHPPALNVLDHLHLLRWHAGLAGARCAHLLQARQVGVAQHQADVGMSDQTPLRVDHVGLPVRADLDLRHHVPDELEIDLRDAHPGVPARASHPERHIGFRLAAEIDRPIVDLLRHRLGEFGVLGEVGLAPDHVHGDPRHLELLAARGIELGKLGDRRNLAQQAQRVEAPLLERAGRP